MLRMRQSARISPIDNANCEISMSISAPYIHVRRPAGRPLQRGMRHISPKLLASMTIGNLNTDSEQMV
jgi:hypothetical protein